MKKILIILLLIFISFSQNSNGLYSAKQNTELFNEIITLTNSSTMEYGVKVNFTIKEDQENYVLKLLEKLDINTGEVNVIKDGNIYCAEFTNTTLKGYIESIEYENHNVVTISLTEINNENKVSELRNKIEKVIERSDRDFKSFQYLKAKINDDDIRKVNENIISYLKTQNAENIETVNLDNGFSTVAYTKGYTSIKNDGKLIDLNVAVCKYSSGNYVIIGTPIIDINY